MLRAKNVGNSLWVELGIAAHLPGTYPFRGAVRGEPGGDVAVLQMQEATQPIDATELSTPRLIRKAKYDRYLLVPDADVILAARGFRHLAAVVRARMRAIAAPGLHVIRPYRNRATPEYLAWCLNHPKTQAAISLVAQGTHAPFVAKQALVKLQIPLPSLEMQGRIVEVYRLREREKDLAAKLASAKDSLIDAATWEAATGVSGELS